MEQVLDGWAHRRRRESLADAYWREHAARTAEGFGALIGIAAVILSFF